LLALTLQPTTRRAKRSRMTARYSHPSSVAMYVTSPAQTRSGCSARVLPSRHRSTHLDALGLASVGFCLVDSVLQRGFRQIELWGALLDAAISNPGDTHRFGFELRIDFLRFPRAMNSS
jgi:hypothetical protein